MARQDGQYYESLNICIEFQIYNINRLYIIPNEYIKSEPQKYKCKSINIMSTSYVISITKDISLTKISQIYKTKFPKYIKRNFVPKYIKRNLVHFE